MQKETEARAQETQTLLGRYGLTGFEARLIRHNENETYRVADASGAPGYVLRVRRSKAGFQLGVLGSDVPDDALLGSELTLLEALADAGFPCQRPVRDAAGRFVTRLDDGACATLLSWVEGETLQENEQNPIVLRAVGRMAARLHAFLRTWPGLPCLSRYHYDDALYARVSHELEGAPALTPEQRRACLRAVEAIRVRSAGLEPGYCHADMGASNLLWNGSAVVPIDFSLSGFAPYELELGMLCATFHTEAQRSAILEGYASVSGRAVCPCELEPFQALSVLLFIACQHGRAGEWSWFPASMERWTHTMFEPLAKDTFGCL